MPSRRIVRDVNEEARDVARALATTEEFEQSRRSRSALRCYLLTSSASCGSTASDCVGLAARSSSLRWRRSLKTCAGWLSSSPGHRRWLPILRERQGAL